jgi:transitional endoplasmic reticulum ATPase
VTETGRTEHGTAARADQAGARIFIASVRPAGLDARRGIVRLHPQALRELGLRTGDPVRLAGRRTSGATVAAAEPTGDRRLLYADDLVLGNLGVRAGGEVAVEPVAATPATRLVLDGPPEIVAVVSPELLRLAQLGKVVTAADNVSLLPLETHRRPQARAAVEAARSSLANMVGYAWTSTLLTVVDVAPGEVVVVDLETTVGWLHGAATHPRTAASATTGRQAAAEAPAEPARGAPAEPARGAPAEPAAPEPPTPKIEDLPGLRAQAHELSELLDLGFRHSEVLERLGTTINLGALVAGAPGSGKSSLVRAVAASIGATVRRVWAPELAVLTNTAATARLQDAAAPTSESPHVLLLADVEALAPREEPGPMSTVLRQVFREALTAGNAVVCTTSRPEALDPGLRSPDLLSLQLTVPMPDAALRAEQLAVLTKPMPLRDDVSLEEVAARTPGFVAADLRALAREAAVQAARRQRDEAHPEVSMADFETALDVVEPSSMAESTLELDTVTLDDVGDLAEVKTALTEAVLWPLTYPDTFARLGIRSRWPTSRPTPTLAEDHHICGATGASSRAR